MERVQSNKTVLKWQELLPTVKLLKSYFITPVRFLQFKYIDANVPSAIELKLLNFIIFDKFVQFANIPQHA